MLAVGLISWITGALMALASFGVVNLARLYRGPVQVFEGRVFPHPQDERWEVGSGVASIDKLRVVREGSYDQVWTRLDLNGVRIASGHRAARYLRAIEAARRERDVAKALEAIP